MSRRTSAALVRACRSHRCFTATTSGSKTTAGLTNLRHPRSLNSLFGSNDATRRSLRHLTTPTQSPSTTSPPASSTPSAPTLSDQSSPSPSTLAWTESSSTSTSPLISPTTKSNGEPLILDNALRSENPRLLPVPNYPDLGSSVHLPDPVRADTGGYNADSSTKHKASVIAGTALGMFRRSAANPRIGYRLTQLLTKVFDMHPRFYYDELQLPANFQSWFAVTDLHLWMLFVRCRKEGDDKQMFKITEVVMNEVFRRAEERLRQPPYNLKAGRTIDQHLKEYLTMHHGAVLGYDEGLFRGDAVLGMALWRNVFSGNTTTTTPRHIALLVQHVRRQLYILDQTPIEYLRSAGSFPAIVPINKLVNDFKNIKRTPVPALLIEIPS